eukprot:TRINITY_DN2634_c0_g1_i1.p1 TRINITY_DN2634_c0_g1~~TRINITY_DN2634_c0_g1_i1.p1  ORF type:complete len:319 (+),score=116.76 TRINITY_DN2634_c0_g1_i1:48-1004(+)
MLVLIADAFSNEGMETLTNAGHEIVFDPSLKEAALKEALQKHNPEVLVVRSTKVPEDMLTVAPHLKFIIRAGAGYNTIAFEKAAEMGIAVSNVPGVNSIAVAELTMALALAMDRKIADNVITIRNNKWNKKKFSKAAGMYGKKFGIIGFGNIGHLVATRAKAFGMEVLAYDPGKDAQTLSNYGVVPCSEILDLVAGSDFISVHVPLIKPTKGMINREFVDAMKPGACVLNMSRGGIHDDEALLYGMNERGIFVCADVFNNEPAATEADFTDAVAQHPSCYGTCHIGASTEQATAAIGERTVEMILHYAETQETLHRVN